MQTGNMEYIYKIDLHQACFQHDMTYGKFLRAKAFEIASNPKFDGYQRVLASMVYKSFDKKSTGSGIKDEI